MTEGYIAGLNANTLFYSCLFSFSCPFHPLSATQGHTTFSLTQVRYMLTCNISHQGCKEKKTQGWYLLNIPNMFCFLHSASQHVLFYAYSLAATVCNLAPRSHLQFAIAKIQCPLVIICKHGQHHQCGWQKFLACNILGLHRKYLIVFNCTKNKYFSYD